MIYLIGGAPRTGKSLLAQKLINIHPVPSFSCDFLYELAHIKSLPGFRGGDIVTKGRLFYPTLKELLVDVRRRSENCVIDGEVILPEFIPELAAKYDIRSCFIGLSATSLDTILAHGGYFNWPRWKLENGFEDQVKGLAERTISRSLVIKAQAQKYNLPYFDLAKDYNAGMELAIQSLFA